MNGAMSCILLLVVVIQGASQRINAALQSQKEKNHLVHFVVINMSGRAREVHHRGDMIPLPVAVLVPLQVPAGDNMEITSTSDTKVEEVITIAATDEGHTIPIR